MTDAAVVRTAGRLPAEVTSFVGRRRELAEVRRLLAGARLVTLLGPGGVGKTRLATRVAREARRAFPDGVCFVDLAAVRGAGMLAQAVVDALGLDGRSTRAPVEVLAEHMADRRLLVVFDTCEHLVDECAVLTEALLRSGPGPRVLATSRQPLDVPGEHTLPIAPLEVGGGEAVALFAERAAAVAPDFAVTPENRADVERLCHRLEGIPLAIELAAVRLRALPLAEIVARLDDRFQATGGRRTSQHRHQTLRGAIDWSHGLCTPAEQAAWARLSVFPDGCDLAGIGAVCCGDDVPAAEVLDVVAGLVDKSVLTRGPDGRYRMLDTLREYGLGLLADRGEAEAVRRRCRDHYVATAERMRGELVTAAQRDWFAWTARESGNLRAVLDRMTRSGDADGALRVLSGVLPVWTGLGWLREARLWGERALGLAGGDRAARFRVLALTAFVVLTQGDRDAQRVWLERGDALAAGEGERAYLVQGRGMAELIGGDVGAAARLLAEAVARHGAAGNDDVLALSTGVYLTGARLFTGDLAGAQEAAQRVVDACRTSGERWCLAHALWARGGARMFAGDLAGAEEDARESLRSAESLGSRIAVTSAVELLAMVALETGEAVRATRLLASVHVLREAQGLSVMEGAFAGVLEASLARLRGALGDRAFEEAWEAGLAMSCRERLACARREEEAAVPAPRDGPGGDRLTPREREIAALVAEGLSNREIAARLVISKRTVDSHLEHILGKLGFSSRTQVATWFARGER